MMQLSFRGSDEEFIFLNR